MSGPPGMVMELAQAGEVRLAVERHGSGDPVVLIAGIGAGREMWLPSHISDLTRAGFEAVAFNNRGVPPSDVPSPPYSIHAMAAGTATLIEALDLPAISVIGFSLGALIAQELALARPQLVRAAVLIGSLGRKDLTRRRLGEHAAQELTAAEPPSLPPTVVRALQLFGPATLDNDAWMAAYCAYADSVAAEVTPGLVGQQQASTAYDDRLANLAGIAVPCLVLSFALDVLSPAALGRELAAAIPDARYIAIPACGHGGLWEKPDQAGGVIVDFLAGLDTDPSTTPQGTTAYVPICILRARVDADVRGARSVRCSRARIGSYVRCVSSMMLPSKSRYRADLPHG